jgi:hypothetical protein
MEERSRSAPLPRSRQKEYQRVELRECGATRAPSWQRKGGILKVANTEKDERCNTEDALGWEARGFWQELPDDQQSASSQSGLFGESSGWPMHTLLHWRWRRRCNVKCTVPVFLSQQKTYSQISANVSPNTEKPCRCHCASSSQALLPGRAASWHFWASHSKTFQALWHWSQ